MYPQYVRLNDLQDLYDTNKKEMYSIAEKYGIENNHYSDLAEVMYLHFCDIIEGEEKRFPWSHEYSEEEVRAEYYRLCGLDNWFRFCQGRTNENK